MNPTVNPSVADTFFRVLLQVLIIPTLAYASLAFTVYPTRLTYPLCVYPDSLPSERIPLLQRGVFNAWLICTTGGSVSFQAVGYSHYRGYPAAYRIRRRDAKHGKNVVLHVRLHSQRLRTTYSNNISSPIE